MNNNMEIAITREIFTLPNGDQVCHYQIKQTDHFHTHFHTFFYNPQNAMFANACFFTGAGNKKILPLSDIDDIWQPTIASMLVRYRQYVVNEYDFSKIVLGCAQTLAQKEELYPVLSDEYVNQIQTIWGN